MSWKRLLVLPMLALGLALPLPASARIASAPRIIASVEPGPNGSFGESMAIDSHGNLFVSVTDWMLDGVADVGRIWKIAPNGTKSQFGPDLDAGGGLLTGLVFDDAGNLYVAAATFGLDLAPGVFRVTSTGPVRVLTLPDWSFPNGLAFHAGDLYVSDSNGAIWRTRPRAGRVDTPADAWLADVSLAPATGWEGVNGIAFRNNDLFAVNADTGTIVRIPVLRDGSAGPIRTFASDPGLVTADGVTFDAGGNLWVAINHEPAGSLARVSTGGAVTYPADRVPWLDYPTQPVFGVAGASRGTLYVENGSFSNGTPNIVALSGWGPTQR